MPMACCRCNKSRFCWGCACVKAKKWSENCLPGKLGNCANRSTANATATNTNSQPKPGDSTTTTTATTISATNTISSAGNPPPDPVSSNYPQLPEFPSASGTTFTWGKLSRMEIVQIINAAYAEVVQVHMYTGGETISQCSLGRLERTL